MNTVFNMILTVLKAFKSGEELDSSKKVKQAQVVANGAVGIAAGALTIAKAAGVEIPLDPDTISTVANGVVSILAVVNAGATVATSKKVGF